MSRPPFYIVLQTRDLSESRRFYGGVLGGREVNGTADAATFDLYGHHWVCQWNPALGRTGRITTYYNFVQNHGLPVPRAGVILEPTEWDQLAERLVRHQLDFMVEPTRRFRGRPNEESLMIFLDPSGNGLEFKCLHEDCASAPAGSLTQ